jgi:phage baseplate assembly protein W
MASLNDVLGTDILHQSDLVAQANGDLATQSGLDNMRTALFHRLVTSPGSLAHRPNYGVGIKDYQNAPGSLTIYRKLAQRIQEQFVQDERVEEVTGVRISSDDANPSLIVLAVTVKIVGYQETELKFTPFTEGV